MQSRCMWWSMTWMVTRVSPTWRLWMSQTGRRSRIFCTVHPSSGKYSVQSLANWSQAQLIMEFLSADLHLLWCWNLMLCFAGRLVRQRWTNNHREAIVSSLLESPVATRYTFLQPRSLAFDSLFPFSVFRYSWFSWGLHSLNFRAQSKQCTECWISLI